MRKSLLLLTALVLSATSVFAQFASVPYLSNAPRAAKANTFRAAEAGTVWWGYTPETDQSGWNLLGVQAADTYHCAIFIPGNHAFAGGKTIQAVRFALVAEHATDVKAWIATEAPGAVDETSTARLKSVDNNEIGADGVAEVTFDQPFEIPADGAYVGYSFTITEATTQNDKYPIIFIAGEDEPNALVIKTDNAVPNWTDMYGNGFGKLYLNVKLSGEFPDNVASPVDFGTHYVELGKETTAKVQVTNGGETAISSLSYTITANGETSAEQTATLDNPIEFLKTGYFTIPVKADEKSGIVDKTLTITKVNGNANNATSKSANFTVATVSKFVKRGVAVEEYTGTTCGWCPRGLVGMDKMRNEFGEDFIGIGIHRYTSNLNQDAMYISTYNHVSYEGAPSARINRGDLIDPYYGSANDVFDDFRAALAIPATAGLSVKGEWNADSSEVTATATIEPVIDGTYKIEYVLIADGLTGTTQPWRQHNYYHSAYGQFTSPSQLPADLQFLFSTGQIYDQSYVAYYPVFNDVAIANAKSTQTTAPGELKDGEKVTNSYTLSMPVGTAKKELVSAIDKKKVFVVALLINSEGKIANAAKSTIDGTDNAAGIENTLGTATSGKQQRYALDGRQLNAAQHGLNIIRMADGSVKKVMIK